VPQKLNEYSVHEVSAITGWTPGKVATLAKEGKIKRTRTGFYDKGSVDAYEKDRAERRLVKRAEWIVQGEQP